MREAMGIAVFAGMLGVTFFGLIFTPVFYVLIRRVVEGREPSATPETAPAGPAALPAEPGDARA
jgi:multidrug efflux pump